MPPVETPDVQVDSSPAIEVPRDPRANAKWRMTGELPAEPKAASTPAKEPPAEGHEPEGNTAPASAPGNSQEKNKPPKDGAAARLNELLADMREAGLTPAELKAFKAKFQRIQEQVEPGKAPATEKTENPTQQLERPKRPKMVDFATMDEYESALDKHESDVESFNETKRAQAASQKAVHDRIKDAEGRYGTESGQTISSAARTIGGDPAVSGAVKELLGGSPVMVDVLFTLGSKPEDLAAFVDLSKTDPAAAIRKLVVLEQLVEAELKGGGKQKPSEAGEANAGADEGDGTPRGTDGKFKKTSPENKESNAPPPPREVSGRGTPPPDEVDRAVKAGDERAYFRAQNARDLARRRA